MKLEQTNGVLRLRSTVYGPLLSYFIVADVAASLLTSDVQVQRVINVALGHNRLNCIN